MAVLKTYRYRLYPTPAQEELLSKHFGCARWVFNWALREKTARYTEHGVSVSVYELKRQLTELKERPDTAWLSEVSAQCLAEALHNLDRAFTAFFKHGAGYPRFKSRYDRNQSYQVSQYTQVNFDTGRIRLLKFSEGIRGHFERRYEGSVKTTTVTRVPSGKFYVSVVVDTPDTEPSCPPADEAKALGLDFGIKDLVVRSDGLRYSNPKILSRATRRLKIRQRRLSRKVKGSKNRGRARLRLALTHERITNKRGDNLNKISSEIVRESGATTLCIEDLPVIEMMEDPGRGQKLKQSIKDAAWGELRRQLTYKCRWQGVNLKVIGRWEMSSKTCSSCGGVNSGLTLRDREWTCVCGAVHDRDVNAAINIRKMAFQRQNTLSAPQGAYPNYRRARRKATPVEVPVTAPVNQECQVRDRLGQTGTVPFEIGLTPDSADRAVNSNKSIEQCHLSISWP